MADQAARTRFSRLVVVGTVVLFVVLMLLNLGVARGPAVFGSRAFAVIRLVVSACFTVGLALCVALWLLRGARRRR